MTATQVTYRRLASFGNHEHVAYEVTVQVTNGDVTAARMEAEGFVDGLIAAKVKEGDRWAESRQTLADIEWEVTKKKNELERLTDKATKMKAFLEKHGVKVEDDLPF